jgi:hypothetical protein
MPSKNEKKLYSWDWVGGGYNQCYAQNKAEARKIGNSMSKTLVIAEHSFRRVKNVASFWNNYPIFD